MSKPIKTNLFSSGYCYISNSFAGHANNNYAHGTDIVDCDATGKALCTSTIKSFNSGTVIWADDLSGYGKVVFVLDSDGKHVYGYGHMSKILVNRGDNVLAGADLGIIGTTGNSTGIHCHFERRYYGDNVIIVNPSNAWQSGRFMDTSLFVFQDPTDLIASNEPIVQNRYRVQVGAFTYLENAQKLAKEVGGIVYDMKTLTEVKS